MTRIRALAVSSLVHAVALGAGSLTWLLTVAPVPEPPIVIRFIPGPPLARIAWPKADTRSETPPREEIAVPQPPPAAASDPAEPPTAAEPAVVDPALPSSAASPSAESPASPAIVETDTFAPPAPTSRYLPAGPRPAFTTGVVDSIAPGTVGREPDAPGVGILQRVAAAGSAGAGRPGARSGASRGLPPRIASLTPIDEERQTGTWPDSAGTPGATPGPEDSERRSTAEILGRRYHVELLDARELGRSTHDGWRYSQLLPLLSEAYRALASQNGMAAPGCEPDEDVRSVLIDPDAIAIAYADGTRHVVAPTRDGLVALYVTAGPAGRTKVDEIRRALGALRRMLKTGERS